jgi:threonylcarbamoyladenosine tRNA methylthiotransferase MtaB
MIAEMNFYLTSLGCKLNQAEIESIARDIEHRGHTLVSDVRLADWAIANTCTVTHIAARKSRQLIRYLKRTNPLVRMALTGCYVDISPQEAQFLADVDLIVANVDKNTLLDRLLEFTSAGRVLQDIPIQATPHRLTGGHTRAMVKIQDGCDNHCTFCVVHIARGPQCSVPPEQVIEEMCERLGEGYREIVLTGVNIGAYGRDSAAAAPLLPSENWSLARLVGRILSLPVTRLRLSSIEPWDFAPELLDMWTDSRLCRHVHLPLQSGCEATLRRMGRRYSAADFERLVTQIRAAVSGVSISTDLIVGFPGETDQEFEESFRLVQQLELSRLHVFRYSPRPGTAAIHLPNPVDPRTAQERSQRLIQLGEELAASFHRRFVGREVQVLFEGSRQAAGMTIWSGLTDNYLRVEAPSAIQLANTLTSVHCYQADATGLRGELLTA